MLKKLMIINDNNPIARMLEWFVYFTTHFKTGSLKLLVRGPQFEYSVILRLLTMLEKYFSIL